MKQSEREPNIKELMATYSRIGRNLVTYQHIEETLRMMMPYILHCSLERYGDTFDDLEHALSEQKLTDLPDCFSKYQNDKGEGATIEIWLMSLKQVIENRKELIGHLLHFPEMSLNTEEGCSNMCIYLDQNHEAAEFFLFITKQISHSVMMVSGAPVAMENYVNQLQ